MANLPWFPFWVDDFLGSRRVKLMSLEAVGLYTLLLGEQWKDGPIPDDVEQIATLCGRHSSAIADAWAEVRRCFTETPEGMVNERLEEERKRQENKRERKVRAGKKGAKVRWSQQDNSSANSTANANAMRQHKQSEPEADTEPDTTNRARTRKTKLPESWEPTEEHEKRAKGSGLDLGREAEKFRAHAEATGRKMQKWNAAFTQWLMNAEEYAKRNGKGGARGYQDPAAGTDWEAEARRINREA